MLYPFGKPSKLLLRSSEEGEPFILAVVSNREKSLAAVLTHQSIFIFQAETSACTVLIYQVVAVKDDQCYKLHDPSDKALRRSSAHLFLKEHRARLSIQLTVVVRVNANAAAVVAVREKLVLCLSDGWLHRLDWSGRVHDQLSVNVCNIPFTYDQQQSKPEYLSADVRIVKATYSPLIGGFALVLSNGKGALLTSNSPDLTPESLHAVWAQGLSDALCTAVNHRFRLIAFGCKNSELACYNVDEYSGALVLTYRVQLKATDQPDEVAHLGGVSGVQWYPFGQAVAVTWLNTPAVALFSTFGAQLWHNVLDTSTGAHSEHLQTAQHWCSMDFGPEGYQLWLASEHSVLVLPLLRSASVNNPTMSRSSHVCLLSAESVLLSPPRGLEVHAHAPHAVWKRVPVPQQYLANAWPLRFVAGDENWVCVAGIRGLARYNMLSNKWSLFGNESQERQLTVTGGVCLWRSLFTCVACWDAHADRDELRFYPCNKPLDNSSCAGSRFPIDSQVLLLSVREDTLCSYDLASRVFVYRLSLDDSDGKAHVQMQRFAEIRCADLVPHPACVVDIQLTMLNHQQGGCEFCPGVDSLLVNVSGRLLLLSPQKKQSSTGTGANEPYQLNLPLVVAECVEQTWHTGLEPLQGDSTQPHLQQALWLVAGARGMRVWMPLFPAKSTSPVPSVTAAPVTDLNSSANGAFISKRIMLPFELNLYPLVVSASECLALGVDPVWSAGVPHRCSQLYLHHVLRQLLKRNLGLYALQIAATCRHLPYFAHVLELLLHNVLEEEATTSEPIPDPLLPRIVAFIQEFPEFLQTVAHCARKTELALWRQLFACAGNPRDLFEVCLRDKQLDTAASFLIVLQSMEPTAQSKDQAINLLEAALAHGHWRTSADICRFLRSIDPGDMDSPLCTPSLKQAHVPLSSRLSLALSPNDDVTDAFVFGSYGVSRQRVLSTTSPSSETSKTTLGQGQGGGSGGKGSTTPSKTQALSRKQSHKNTWPAAGSDLDDANAVYVHLNMILTKHARHLLATHRLADLGVFSAVLDFHLVLWLSRERSRAARIDDVLGALGRLHTDFAWPYPLLSEVVLAQLSRRVPQNGTTSKGTMNGTAAHSAHTPLTVITRHDSHDSGYERTPVNGASVSSSRVGDPATTRRLLLKQQLNRVASPTEHTAQLQYATPQDHNYGSDNATETSSCVSSPVERNAPTAVDAVSGDSDYWDTLDRAVDSGGRGSHQSESRLRFLQQLMLESVCVEWSLLLALVLRDPVGLARALTVSSLAQAPADTTQRLCTALRLLDDWADANCLGYKPLIAVADRHVQGLLQVHPIMCMNDDSVTLADSRTQPTSAPTTNRRASLSTSTQQTQLNTQHTTTNKQTNTKRLPPSLSTPELRVADSEVHVDVVSAHTPGEPGQCNIM